MKKEYKTLGIIGLIALRKSELYTLIISELEKEKRLSDSEKVKIKEIIAKMENNKFFSKREKSTKKVITSQTIKEIYPNISPVIEEIKLNMGLVF